MMTRAPFMFIASMDVTPEREDLFNRVYDEEHVPSLAKVPGVLEVARFERLNLSMSIGGQIESVPSSQPKYHAIYALERPEVLTSAAWAEAVERGRWPKQVRPFTTNRHHLLARRIGD